MATYYVSTSGSNSNSGTIGSPWATWHYAFNNLSAGDTLYVRGGTYSPAHTLSGGVYVGARMSYKTGTALNPITISAYTGETPILDGSNIKGAGQRAGVFFDSCSYIHVIGLTIRYVNDLDNEDHPAEGMIGGDCDNITLERCTIYHCGNGFAFGGACDYIYYTNCDSYDNSDRYGHVSSGGYGGFANGFTGNIAAGMHHIYYGCRAWLNSDDGYDNMGGGGYITYTNCWAWANGHSSWDAGVTGDGDGFKLGLTPPPKETGTQRICYNCIAFDNDLGGFDESQDDGPVCDMALYNCTAYNNGASGFGFYTTAGGYTGIATLKNCISYDNTAPNVNLRGSCVLDQNSWTDATVTDGDFVSLNSATATTARQSDGSLPVLTYLHLATGSDMIGLGVVISGQTLDGDGEPWSTPRSIGAFEYLTASVPVTSITVSGAGSATTIATPGGTLQMSATVLPVNATNNTVTWSRTNGTGTGTISVSGLLTALTDGTVTVRATANDGSAVFDDQIITISNQVVGAGTYYVSTTGNDGNPGTISSPWKTWDYAFNELAAGDTLYVRGGIYTDTKGVSAGTYYGVYVNNKDGTALSPITVLNYPGEEPILDCSNLTTGDGQHYGIYFNYCDYWDVTGLTVKSVREYTTGGTYPHDVGGWAVVDSTNITLTKCIVTNCGNGFTLAGSVDEIFFTYCDSYLNYDHYDSGGFANGFDANIDAANNVYYEGCRAWSNSDDGFDCNQGGGYVVFTNCVAYRNGYDCPNSGDGDGFRLGYTSVGDEAGNQRILYNCISVGNKLHGFDENMGAVTSEDMALYNCIAYDNVGTGFLFSEASGTGVTTLKNNIAYSNGTDFADRARNVDTYNSWNGVATITDADFVSLVDSQLLGSRNSDGTLPVMTFLHLQDSSDCIGAGETVAGLTSDFDNYTYKDSPAIGPFEWVTPILVSNISVSGTGGATTISTSGGQLQMLAFVTPADAADLTYTWTVTNGTGTAWISNTGLLTAQTDGVVTVRATANDSSGVYGTRTITLSNQAQGVLVDKDGNEYSTITIGTQEWTVENFRCTKFNTGSNITLAEDDEDWVCEVNLTIRDYGLLYNWFAATYNTGGASIAPSGWHVPTKTEFGNLMRFIDVDGTYIANDAGGYLKEIGTTYWQTPNTSATDTYGFAGRGSGLRNQLGSFTAFNQKLSLWNTDESGDNGYCSYLNYNDAIFLTSYGVGNVSIDKNYGYSLRLIKDDSTDPGTMTDYDGNVYDTVKIGTQVWMAENLKVTHYNNGIDIPLITDNVAWAADSAGAYCVYDNATVSGTTTAKYCWYANLAGVLDPDEFKATYGALYNYLALDDLPYLERSGEEEVGWRVPTKTDYATLNAYLGGDASAGGKLKDLGTTYWNSPNTGGTNESGFKALGTGIRSFDGTFSGYHQTSRIWSDTSFDADDSYYLGLTYDSAASDDESYCAECYGYSVRLVRDYTAPVDTDVVVEPYENGNIPVYRFYISEAPSSISYEVFPLKFLSTSIVYEREKNRPFYRRKFNGSLLFGTNSRVLDVSGVEQNRNEDWALLWGWEQHDPDSVINLTITKSVSGVTEDYWDGYFSTSDGFFNIDDCTFEVTPLPIDDYTDILDIANTQYNILNVAAMGTVTATHGSTTKTYTRTRWLANPAGDNVLEYLAIQIAGAGVTVSSEFFTSDPNPITLEDSHTLYLTIAQKSDIIRNTSTDPATTAMLSWNELMDILWGMFQVTWNYDLTTNTINVEHESWFAHTAGIDLRTQLTCVATNKYSYVKEQMPKYEKLTMMEADGTNFVGTNIWYDSGAVNQDPDSNSIETVIPVTTDLEYIIDNEEAIADEGFVILCNYLDGGSYYVRLDYGKLNNAQFALNMNLSVANLQDAYWRHNRILISGYLNASLTTFWTARKTKQQECTAILCEELDPDEDITTELGETYFGGAMGQIKTASVSPTGETKFNLLYGPADNVNTGVPDLFGVEVALAVESPVDPAFDEIYLVYTFNQPAPGDIVTRFRDFVFNDLGVVQDAAPAWTTVTLLTGTRTISVLNHQILPLSAGWTVSIELEYPTATVDNIYGVADATWSANIPFIYTGI